MLQIYILLTALLLSIVFILALYPCAIKLGFIDPPCSRKQHEQPTPPIGGLAIFLGSLLTMYFFDIQIPHQSAFISAMALLVLVGAIDDNRELNVKVRLLAQIIAALIMSEIADIKITSLGDLLGFGPVQITTHYSTLLTVFAVVGGINAFNMIDGIDGLAGSSSMISIALTAAIALSFNNFIVLNACLLFIGAIAAFLLFNLRILGRKRALIFLGDSGSTLLGFVICWLVISASQGQERFISPVLVLWIIALPLFDSISIMLHRIRKGQSPFKPDRKHLHHILLSKDFSVNKTLSTILTITVVLAVGGIVASLFFNIEDKYLFTTFMLLFALFYWQTHKN